jgi:hypothetical protein
MTGQADRMGRARVFGMVENGSVLVILKAEAAS